MALERLKRLFAAFSYAFGMSTPGLYLLLRLRVLPASFAMVCLTAIQPVAAQEFLVLGTGGVTGVYYPAGGAICNNVNARRADIGIRCYVEATGGSAYNVRALLSGDLDLAIVQSDVLYKAYKHLDEFSGLKDSARLRLLFALHSEAFTVLARDDSGISKFTDLKGKRVNIGNPGSGQQVVMDSLINAFGWKRSDFAKATEYSSREQARALCSGEVQAIVFIAGHPNPSIEEATAGCKSHFVPVDGPVVEKFIADSPFYVPSIIPASVYGMAGGSVPTFGMAATVVGTDRLPEKAVFEIMKSVFTNLDGIRSQNPALKNLDTKAMLIDRFNVPRHEGAKAFMKTFVKD